MSELLLFCIIIYWSDFCTLYSVDLDQTLRFAASDLGLYCLPLSLLWNVRHKWVYSTPERGYNLIIKHYILFYLFQIHDYFVNSLGSYFRLSWVLYNFRIWCVFSITPIHAARQCDLQSRGLIHLVDSAEIRFVTSWSGPENLTLPLFSVLWVCLFLFGLIPFRIYLS